MIKTDAFFRAKLGSLDPLSKWWYDCIKGGAIVNKKDEIIFNWTSVEHLRTKQATKQQVFQCYNDSGAKKVPINVFWPKLTGLQAGVTGRINAMDKARIITFNSLAECRAGFMAAHDKSLPWFSIVRDLGVQLEAVAAQLEADKHPMEPGGSLVDCLGDSDDDDEGEESLSKRSRSTSPGSHLSDYNSASDLDVEMADMHISSEEEHRQIGLDLLSYCGPGKSRPVFKFMDKQMIDEFNLLPNPLLFARLQPLISGHLRAFGWSERVSFHITERMLSGLQGTFDNKKRESVMTQLLNTEMFWSKVQAELEHAKSEVAGQGGSATISEEELAACE